MANDRFERVTDRLSPANRMELPVESYLATDARKRGEMKAKNDQYRDGCGFAQNKKLKDLRTMEVTPRQFSQSGQSTKRVGDAFCPKE